MSEWKKVKLGEVAEIINGYAFKSQDFLNIKIENSLPIIKIKNVANGDTNLDSVQYHLYEHKLEKFLIKKDDILIALTGNHPQAQTQVVGAVSKYKLDAFALLNQRVAKVETKSSVCHNFIYYFFKYNGTHEKLANQSSGSANQANITKTDIENLEISLPSLAVQKEIAGILSSFDDKIDLLHRQNTTLESLAKILFHHHFITNPNRNKWQIGKLSDYGKIICGKTPSKSKKEFFNGWIPFIKIPDMHNNVFVFEAEDSLSELGKKSQQNKTLPPKSIMVSCIATVGLVSMNAFESQTNQQINSIVANKEFYRYFLFCYFRNLYDELQLMASGGTATLNLNTTDFSKIDIFCPTDECLIDFHNVVVPLFDKIYQNSKQIKILNRMRDIMLPKLLNREIKV